MSEGETESTQAGQRLWRRLAGLMRVDEPLVVARTLSAVPTVAIAGALVVGLIAAVATAFVPHPITLGGVGVGDIGPPAVSGKLFLAGRSPYQVTLTNVDITLYPFTTSIALAPLLLLSPKWWAPSFMGVVSALLAFAILARGEPWRLMMFLSVPFWSAVLSVQWSPLFAAALLLPALLPVAVVKPQLGIVLALAGRWRARDVVVAVAFFVLSVAMLPSWPLQWLRQGRLEQYEGRIPLMIGAGVLLASCVFLWREGRARLLLAMSIIAQRYFYDQLLLFLVPRNVAQMSVLLGVSWAGAAACYWLGWWVPSSGIQDARVWHSTIVTIFVPCLAMVWMDRWRRVSEIE